MRRGIVFLLLAIFALPAPISAADLRLGLAVEPDSIDPHYHNFGGNKGLMPNLFEALTAIDAKDHLTPNLAVSWRLIDDTTWEFELRSGVTFSDGTPLTADDVAFTIERVPNVLTTVTDMSEYVKPIARVEVVDPHTVRFHTKGPFPLAPEYLSAIGIVSRRTAKAPARPTTTPARRRSAPGRSASSPGRAATGSCWHATSHGGAGSPAWDSVTIRYIKNPASRLAALLAGDVDLIDQVSVQDIARVKEDARFTVASGLSDDIVGFVFDVQDHSSPKITEQRRQAAADQSVPRPPRARGGEPGDRPRCHPRPHHERPVRSGQPVHEARPVRLRSRSAAAALRSAAGAGRCWRTRAIRTASSWRSTARTIASSTMRRSARRWRRC